MSATEPAFELVGVSQRYGALAALADIDLSIVAGESVALVGPSGAGKSTLIGLLNGSVLPSQGQVRVLGQDLARLTPGARRRLQTRVGTVYQQFHLVDNLRVVHNVNAGHLGRWSLLRSAFSLAWPQETDAAARALERVGIREKLYERTDRLSGGQQQRVALARVLVQDPAAILADEPIASLDPERGREIMDLLRDTSTGTGRTLVVSLHAVEFALSHCQRVIGLREGRIVFDASADEVDDGMVARLYRIEPHARPAHG